MSRKYAIIDIETTGGMLRRDKIIEVAVVVHDGKQIIDRFESLVKPGRSLSRQITVLTGITNEMLVDAPWFYEVAKKLVEITEDCIFVAHNARFDYSFIRRAFENLGYTYTRKQLCTARLSRMLLPDLRRHGLDSLCRYYNVTVKNRHRAMDDVLATTEIFESLLSLTDGDEAVNKIVNYGIKASRLPAAISLEHLHALPEQCGVYYFHNAEGDVIYVGKSINIKKRVMQHFAQNTGKAIKLAQRVHDITYTCTGSELVALLLEEKEIKRLQPEVNRALRKKLFPFALYYFPDNEGYFHIRAEKIRKQTPLGYSIIKEYPKLAYAKGHLEGLIDEFDLCQNKSGEQTGSGACFNHRIGKCSGACLQLEDIESYNDRVIQAVSYLQRIVHDSFYLIDQGREPGEKSVVMVEDGQFRGFGYMQDGVVIQHQEDLEDIIDIMPASRDAQRIIYWYVREKKMEQIIHFN